MAPPAGPRAEAKRNMLWGQTDRLQCSKGASSGGPDKPPWSEMHVPPDLNHLAVFPSAEEPARPDVSRLSGFFGSLQWRNGGVIGAPPEGPATRRSQASSTASTTAGRTRARPQARALRPGPTPPGPLTAGPLLAPASATPRTWRHRPIRPRIPNRDFWWFAPAFTPAGEWPGRPPDAAPGVDPSDGASAASRAAALPPAPTVAPAPDDATPVRGGLSAGPARAFEHHPATLLPRRCAEIAFKLDVPPPGDAACDAI